MVLSLLFHLLDDCSVTNTIPFFILFFHTNNVRETYCVWCLGSGGFFQCSVLLSLHCITHYCFAMKSRRIMASSFMKDTSSMFSDTFGMVQIFLIWCRTSSLSMGCDQWSSPIQTSKCTGVRAFHSNSICQLVHVMPHLAVCLLNFLKEFSIFKR